MRERKTRIQFKCPKCGHESERSTRIGGLFSNKFVCEKCGTVAIASGYLMLSALYGAIVLVLLVLGIKILQEILGPDIRFEYILGIVVVALVLLILMASKYYWKLTLRWKIAADSANRQSK